VIVLVLAGSLALGVLVGAATVQRLGIGETYEEWRDATPSGWHWAVQVVLAAMFLSGLFVSSGELTAVLIGIPGGCWLYYGSVGVRRRRRERSPDSASMLTIQRELADQREQEELDKELEEAGVIEPLDPWRWRIVGVGGGFLLALAGDYLLGFRGVELVGGSVGAVLLVNGSAYLEGLVSRWFTDD
jgi:hypothetical protein